MSTVVIDGGGNLLVNGAPFRINGVAGTFTPENLTLLRNWGGNTIRTYLQQGLGDVLDLAAAHGLFVIVGLNATLTKDMEKEAQRLIACVDRHKAHSAVLLWNIGNEIEHGHTKDSEFMATLAPKLNSLAETIKSRDTNHPVINTFIDFGSKADGSSSMTPSAFPLLAALQQGTSLDAIGINSYTAVPSLAARYATWNLRIPFLVTELGWCPANLGRKVPWIKDSEPDSKIITYEKSSTEKATHIARALASLHAPQSRCLGTVAFRWGSPAEIGATGGTWHTIFMPVSMKGTSVSNEYIRAWTGKDPGMAPHITSIAPYQYRCGSGVKWEHGWTGINLVKDHQGVSNQAKAGDTLTAWVAVDRAGLQFTWELREHSSKVTGKLVHGAALFSEVGGDLRELSFVVPQPGVYRLFVFVEEAGQGVVSSASLPLQSIA